VTGDWEPLPSDYTSDRLAVGSLLIGFRWVGSQLPGPELSQGK